MLDLLFTILDIVSSIFIWIFDVFVPVSRWIFTSTSALAWAVCVVLAGVPGFYAYRFWSHENTEVALFLAITCAATLIVKVVIGITRWTRPQQT
jgi:hypothetical protein